MLVQYTDLCDVLPKLVAGVDHLSKLREVGPANELIIAVWVGYSPDGLLLTSRYAVMLSGLQTLFFSD